MKIYETAHQNSVEHQHHLFHIIGEFFLCKNQRYLIEFDGILLIGNTHKSNQYKSSWK